MKYNRNSDRFEEGLRNIREKIRRSRPLYATTQAMIIQEFSALVSLEWRFCYFITSFFNGISSNKFIVLSGLSESLGPSNLASYLFFVNKNHKRTQTLHHAVLKLRNKKSIILKKPKIFSIILLEKDEKKSESYRN